MKKIIFLIFIYFVFIFNINSDVTGDKLKNNNRGISPYIKPASVSINLFFSPFFNIHNPNFQGLSMAFATTFDISSYFQYRFHKYVGAELGVSLNMGLDITQSKYIESDKITIYSQNIFDLYLQVPLNAIIYIPLNAEFKNNYRINFMIKAGVLLEVWLYSLYNVEKNFIKILEGSYHDTIIDGPNQFDKSVDYSKLITPANIGLNLGFASKFHSNRLISVYPEIGIKIFFIPTLFGKTANIGGNSLLLSRNDGISDYTVSDFKLQIYAGVSLSFDFGDYKDNLSDIIKEQKNNNKSETK